MLRPMTADTQEPGTRPRDRLCLIAILGLAILAVFKLSDDLKAGRLVSILPDYRFGHGELSLVRPPAPFEPSKLRVFIDFINAALRERAREEAVLMPE